MEKFAVQFKELEQLEANEWKKPEPEKRKPVKRVIRVNRPKPVCVEKTVAAAKSRPPLRALIAQKRAEAAGTNLINNFFSLPVFSKLDHFITYKCVLSKFFYTVGLLFCCSN